MATAIRSIKMKTYRITWTIDIDAENYKDAARQALEIQRDRDSIATVFDVQEPNGNHVQIDLNHPIFKA